MIFHHHHHHQTVFVRVGPCMFQHMHILPCRFVHRSRMLVLFHVFPWLSHRVSTAPAKFKKMNPGVKSSKTMKITEFESIPQRLIQNRYFHFCCIKNKDNAKKRRKTYDFWRSGAKTLGIPSDFAAAVSSLSNRHALKEGEVPPPNWCNCWAIYFDPFHGFDPRT